MPLIEQERAIEAKVKAARAYATYAINLHLEEGWSFRFNKRRRALGLCNYMLKTIELSKEYVQLNDIEHIKQTILHEIAHALAGPLANHGPRWKLEARKLGVTELRATTSATMPPGKYSLVCDHCDKVLTRSVYRRRSDIARRYHCKCGTESFGKLRYEEN